MAHKRGIKTELGGTPTPRRTVTYDDFTERLLRVLGNGNVSRGVRTAARLAYAVRNTPHARGIFTPSTTTGSPDAQPAPDEAPRDQPQLQPGPLDAPRA